MWEGYMIYLYPQLIRVYLESELFKCHGVMTITMTRPQTGGNVRSANQRAALSAIDQ